MTWKSLLVRAATCAAATSATVSVLSTLQTGRPAAALNAVSHILWGKRAFRANRLDVSHTLAGTLLNAAAMLSWSVVYELLPEAHTASARLAKAAGVTALAYITDYHVVPQRLTPGFEERLSPAALALVYAVLGASFFAASDSDAETAPAPA